MTTTLSGKKTEYKMAAFSPKTLGGMQTAEIILIRPTSTVGLMFIYHCGRMVGELALITHPTTGIPIWTAFVAGGDCHFKIEEMTLESTVTVLIEKLVKTKNKILKNRIYGSLI